MFSSRNETSSRQEDSRERRDGESSGYRSQVGRDDNEREVKYSRTYTIKNDTDNNNNMDTPRSVTYPELRSIYQREEPQTERYDQRSEYQQRTPYYQPEYNRPSYYTQEYNRPSYYSQEYTRPTYQPQEPTRPYYGQEYSRYNQEYPRYNQQYDQPRPYYGQEYPRPSYYTPEYNRMPYPTQEYSRQYPRMTGYEMRHYEQYERPMFSSYSSRPMGYEPRYGRPYGDYSREYTYPMNYSYEYSRQYPQVPRPQYPEQYYPRPEFPRPSVYSYENMRQYPEGPRPMEHYEQQYPTPYQQYMTSRYEPSYSRPYPRLPEYTPLDRMYQPYTMRGIRMPIGQEYSLPSYYPRSQMERYPGEPYPEHSEYPYGPSRRI